MRGRRIVKGVLLAILGVCALVGGPRHVPAQSLREYQIKAAFLYNFLKFVDWPSEVLPESSDVITVCVFGDDPFGEALESIKDKLVKGRRLTIRRLGPVKDLESCHVLFIGASEEARLPQVVQSLRGASVLTIGEIEGFAESGGIINFVVKKNKVHFEINLNNAERARLKLSSQLLSVARVVRQ